MITIRKAKEADCPAMMELIQELATYQREPEGVSVTMEEFVASGFGTYPVWGAFVAERNNKIVGMALHYIRYSTWKGRSLYLEDLIVTKSERGNGVGKLLLDATIAYAKEMNYSGMTWQVSTWNDPAINFYKKYETEFDKEWMNVSLTFAD
ncbi:GNAT family N-acetyltransferase [Sphingobacterium psychroaquaticum]|uniref:L-amino acid N-acyltransferase YncA n=1 Tax=Sphingobacterium psychroaquaticum TaxID=561061 RepID=A0A1X7JV03_9SPHI|nr:GNAT family N-acetyltransferase [Sphingobacterium psychroaquaticum]QBQ41175.1 GNAT family N-acetyltransferase [Sphingobacterium psychroaquaticum]SMG31638.1 L-amino acid N-acyltransferase YncA [Sphingobacterium psychroaquaticum]